MTRLSASQSFAWCSLVREEGINEEGCKSSEQCLREICYQGLWMFGVLRLQLVYTRTSVPSRKPVLLPWSEQHCFFVFVGMK